MVLLGGGGARRKLLYVDPPLTIESQTDEVTKTVHRNLVLPLPTVLDWMRPIKPEQGRIQGVPRGPGPPPLTTKNEAPAPKFYKTEAPEWQF